MLPALVAATIAISGVRLIDGRGGAPVEDANIIIDGERITAAGPRLQVVPPPGAQLFDGKGLTLLPGFLDAHFHLGRVTLPSLFLSHGVTSVRDPGAWNQSYEPVKNSGLPIPRLFLTCPHLDMFPPAYPENSYMVADPDEARAVVNPFIHRRRRHRDQGLLSPAPRHHPRRLRNRACQKHSRHRASGTRRRRSGHSRRPRWY